MNSISCLGCSPTSDQLRCITQHGFLVWIKVQRGN